ncbi:MAG: GNAT family N-acetyltransferase [Deltaproteobacteria bacterium]|nr:GNAT family N-acetyltransferase [Deltaproteobacteria bacterium]
MTALRIRPIEPRDDAPLAAILRAVRPTFGAIDDGVAFHDPELDRISHYNAGAGHAYFVVEDDEGVVVGGGGIAPLPGTDDGTCELHRMYFLPRARGRGAGRALLERCLESARSLGYRRCYLETLTGMDAAQALYEKLGFVRLPAARGATGHHGCNRFYQRELASS